jgi:hypothetical protein
MCHQPCCSCGPKCLPLPLATEKLVVLGDCRRICKCPERDWTLEELEEAEPRRLCLKFADTVHTGHWKNRDPRGFYAAFQLPAPLLTSHSVTRLVVRPSDRLEVETLFSWRRASVYFGPSLTEPAGSSKHNATSCR